MGKLLLILTLVATISSCSSPCEISERKIQKIEAKCPESFKQTIVVRDTIVLPPQTLSDTVFITKPQDTVVLEDKGFKLKLIRSFDTITIDSLVYQQDTVFVEKEIIVERLKLEVKPPFFKRLGFWITIILGILCGFILLSFTKRALL